MGYDFEEETLERFASAQEHSYSRALDEIKDGCKRSCWMWFIFPQLRGLGQSDTAYYYGIAGLAEAEEYIADPLLGGRLVEISRAVLSHPGKRIDEIFGRIDAMKLRSSMTLFEQVSDDPVFAQVLDTFFGGERDALTFDNLRDRGEI